MPDDKIHIERFVIAKSDKAEDLDQPSTEQEKADAQTVLPASTVQLEIDGMHHVIPCESGQTVLDAAESIGIELPYSCREGMCASCMCEVIEGSVKLNNNEVLDEKDLANNLTLSCQAVPLTTELKLKYT
jgi:3-ketosteroid 9alpha-monooxygenase subunit B